MSLLRRIWPPMGLLTAIAAAGLTAFGMPVLQVTVSRGGNPAQADSVIPPAIVSSAVGVETAASDIAPELWNRPLFAEGRRPPAVVVTEPVAVPDPVPAMAQPEVAAVSEPAAPPPLPDIRMLGTMTRNGEMRALVSLAESGTEIWVADGHEFDGWMLTKISQSAIQLTYQTNEVTIQLFE